MSWPTTGQSSPDCSRLRSWLSDQDAAAKPRTSTVDRQAILENVRLRAQQLSVARRPLIWIESADVLATRAAVSLAETCRAKVHVAQSPGAENVTAVTASSGTFGTSLAEVAAHADVIVHLGQRHLHELPRLASRFLHGNAYTGLGNAPRHIFIGELDQSSWLSTSELGGGIGQRRAQAEELDGQSNEPLMLEWPREAWLDQLTRVLMVARGAGLAWEKSTEMSDRSAAHLAELLAGCRYAVFMWEEDEFADELDRLLVERLFEIAEHFSRTTRCSLLPLSTDPGRVTAKETLLWLTNVAGTADCVAGIWSRPIMKFEKSLRQWQAEHDWILCVRNLPSDRPLPHLNFHFTIDAACNQHMSLTQPRSAAEEVEHRTALVAAVGLDASGYLFRLDHAFGAHLDALSTPASAQPALTAEEVLREFAKHLLAARER